MQPNACEGSGAGEGLALGSLVLVVGKDVVDPAGVDVDLGPEVLGAHSGALDVPPREPWPPGAGPDQLCPTGLGGLPQGKVARVFLQRVDLDADALAQAFAGQRATELAVPREARDAEVHVASALVRVAAANERLGDLDHACDVLGGAGEDVGGQDIDALLVAQKLLRVPLRDLA